MVSKACLAALLALSFSALVVEGCVFTVGTAANSLAPHKGTAWDHNYAGDDWINGTDGSGKPWVCATSMTQSPIDFPQGLETGKGTTAALRTRWAYPKLVSNGSDVMVINTGHTIQVEWTAPFDSKVYIPSHGDKDSTVLDVLTKFDGVRRPNPKWARATPIQFHFHANSEHTIKGAWYPLELHIVHVVPQSEMPGCPVSPGCLSVTGIMFKVSTEVENPLLDVILDHASEREGVTNLLPKGLDIDLQGLLPQGGKSAYYQYQGSLTTPPCSEGLLWHVFHTPVVIGINQLNRYKELVGLKDCELKNSTHNETMDHMRRHLHSHMEHEHEQPKVESLGYSASSLIYSRARNLAEADHNPDDYTCDVVGYGYNFRNVQPLHSRLIRRYA
mmetsp:Transcript_40554/g.90130  ORF Transcript_40554/g.90130 Transcript_40554/m.90130 type:complete len:388 (-) Transcript_40554:1854-3017(-)